MGEGGVKSEVSSNQTTKNSGRWDFLKKPIQNLWRKGFGKDEPDDFVPNPGRRNFIKKAAIAAGVGMVAGVGAAVWAEKSMPKATIDEEVNIDGNKMHILAEEFYPEDGKIKDPEEAVFFLIGAPMRANASVTWEGPKSVAEYLKARTYEIDARPMGPYSGDAIDLEVAALISAAEKLGIKKLKIFTHSVGFPKALKMVAEIQGKGKNIQVDGIVAANPVGFYAQDKLDIVGRYFADGANQGKLANPREKHPGLPEVARNIVGSIANDVKDTGIAYPKLVADQMKSATQVSPDLARVHAPVVILLGSQDKVSKKDMVLPAEQVANYLPLTTRQGELMRNILRRKEQNWERGKWGQLTDQERSVFGNKAEFVKVQKEQMVQIGRANDAYTKVTYLPNAENVKVIVANKYASHLAFNERRDMTSHVVSKIFERMRRPNPPASAA